MRIIVVATAICSCVIGLGIAGEVEAAIKRPTNIPAQRLDQALRMFAQSRGLAMAYRADLVHDLRTAGAIGELTASEALTKLLTGTGLTYRYLDESTVTLVPLSAGGDEASSHAAPDAPSSAPAADEQKQTARITLEEIVVTATKRTANARDVPAAVTAFRVDKLAQTGLLKVTDYAALVPGLNVNDATAGGGQNAISIRGITTGPTGNPTIGIFVDDAPLGSAVGMGGGSSMPDVDPSDLERIEVLRGPQGTFYGGGSMGGLIKYVTKMPDFESFSGRLELDGSSIADGGADVSARGSMNVPLSEDLALRGSAFSRTDPGFIDNVQTSQEDVNRRKYDGGRLSLAARLGEAFTVRLSTATQRIDADGTSVIDVVGATGAQVNGDLQTRRAPGSDNSRNRDSVHDLRITGDLGWAELISSSAYQDRELRSNFDYSPVLGPLIDQFFGVPGVGAAVFTSAQLEKFSQEIRLSSKSDGNWNWQLGVFYTDEKSEIGQRVNTFDVLTGSALLVPLPTLLDYSTPFDFEETAAFGNINYSFTTRFDTTFGVRYSENTQGGTQVSEGVLIGPLTSIAMDSDGSSVTYLVNPRFKITDNVMIYARVASGYQPGGPNPVAPAVPLSFDESTVVNYETGLKLETADRSLSFEAAAYFIDWQDIQARQVSAIGTSYYINAGEAHSQGVEGTLSWRPMPGLLLAGNATYNEAELDEALPGGTARAGARLPDTPHFAGMLAAEYAFALRGDWTAIVGASVRYVGERTGALVQDPFMLPSYTTFDLRTGVENDRYSINLFGRNLGDERGYVSAFPFGAIQQVAIIQPRTIGISIAASF